MSMYIYVYVYVYLYMYMCIYRFVCVYIYIYAYVYICVHICVYIYICVYVCICIYIYTCLCIYIYSTHIHIHIRCSPPIFPPTSTCLPAGSPCSAAGGCHFAPPMSHLIQLAGRMPGIELGLPRNSSIVIQMNNHLRELRI